MVERPPEPGAFRYSTAFNSFDSFDSFDPFDCCFRYGL